MVSLQSLDDLNKVVNTCFRKGTITNNYLLIDSYVSHINEGRLMVSCEGSNAAFILDKSDFYKLYFYLNDLNLPINLPTDKPIVMEILYRGRENRPQQIIEYWEGQGFVQHLSRNLMVASSSHIVLPDIQMGKIHTCLATMDHEVEFAKQLFDEALDKYTGDRLSYSELYNFMTGRNLICAYYEKELAGILQFEIKNKVVWLGHIAIHSDFRGRGIANVLVHNYITRNISVENTRYALWVIQENEPAIKLYCKFGFEYGNKSTTSLLKLNQFNK